MNKKFRFTDSKLGKLPVPSTSMAYWYDTEVLGLCFRITNQDARSFCLRYRTPSGRERYWTFGKFSMTTIPDWTVAAARTKAAELKDGLKLGRDPADEVRAAREAPTVKELADRFIKEHVTTLKPGTRYDYTRTIHHDILPALGRMTIEEVARKDIAALHHKVSLRSASRANTVVSVCSKMFSCAIRWELRSDNPCQHLGPRGVFERDRVLTDKELGAIWKAAGTAAKPYGSIVRLLALTGQRREEVAGMVWTEVDNSLATWTITGTRTKNGEPNIVPLSEPAQQILRDLLPEDDRAAKARLAELKAAGAWVFPGKCKTVFSGWSNCKAELDNACGVKDWRLHDLRRTLATNFQKLGVRLEVTEAVLNHVSGSRAGVVGVYQRHTWVPEKTAALASWAVHVLRVAEDREDKAEDANVMPFPTRTRQAAG